MENMDKGLTVPKWVLINHSKITQMLKNVSAQVVCPSPKVWDFDEKRFHWVSVVRVLVVKDEWAPEILGKIKKFFKEGTLDSKLFWSLKFQKSYPVAAKSPNS